MAIATGTLSAERRVVMHTWTEEELEEIMNQILDYTTPKTNADKIRAMSDEELADFIKRAVSNCLVDLMYGVCKNQHCCSVCRASHPSVKEWLQSKAK